jgi:hypothetical protein
MTKPVGRNDAVPPGHQSTTLWFLMTEIDVDEPAERSPGDQ